MKQFFGAFFGSCFGILITGVVITLIIIFSIIGTVKEAIKLGEDKHFSVKDNGILRFTLEDDINDRGTKNPFNKLNLGPFTPQAHTGLNDIIAVIKKAAVDKKIKGLYLDISDPPAGFATLEEIRNALIEFKISKKFIYAYSEVYSQKGYYLATVADKIFLNPQGALEIKGLSSQIMFFKNMFEKLNVEVQVFRHGKFKSAIEPYMLDKMSDANRNQVETYLGSLWNQMITGVGAQRKISINQINNVANNLLIENADDALKYKFVDELYYEDEVFTALKKAVSISESEKLNFISLDDYTSSDKDKNKSKDKIAVIYASGEINSGEGDENSIGSNRLCKAIREARLDNTVKAIVLRVNSPGGSALASDIIWRETVLAKKMKPFIVSMGDVAASGGYYISCAADKIFAQPNTITGSIGVFGIIPNAQKALADKLGITIDTVNTNQHSDVGTILRGTNGIEHNYIQKSVERIYDVFITKVAIGRHMQKNNVDSVGQGRVWSGTDALKINLVDELGGLEDAVKYAAKVSQTKNYTVKDYPKRKDPIMELLGAASDDVESRVIKNNFGRQYIYLQQLKQIVNLKGVQARLPYEISIQ